MKVTVCIGSACHVKGAAQIVNELQFLIAQKNCGDKVELGGAFCMGKCQTGVSVTVDDAYHSLKPEDTKTFFEEQVVKKLA
ncbi:MAG: (2Fe-2S) ferredoxin domain-containing protein [Chitinispirillia bacterium]|nr:(2Fe-2S) ferredoxin domain-containing protein [Chitinispirillia bacterium]MCL2268177.1 (2Fe-2S) ferredoxin domain-containing protein [Chitinispirillia bacterium]